MVNLVPLDRVAQGADDVLLADHLVEGPGAVAAVEGGRVAGGRHCGQCIRLRARLTAASRYLAPVPSGARNWLTPAAWVAAVAAVLLLLFPLGFPNYDTIYSLLWGRELARRDEPRPRRGPAPHPPPAGRTARAGRLAAGRRRDRPDDGGRLRLARPGRLPRLPARLALVRPPDRRRRGGDRPHPGAVPLQRAARLHRPSLHRPLPRRLGDRDPAPAGRLAGAGVARPGRPAAPRGLALLPRLPRLSALVRDLPGDPDAAEGGSLERADTQNAGLIRPAIGGRGASSPPGHPWRWRSRRRCSGPCSTGSRRAARPTRSPALARRSRPWSARPARSTSSSTGRGGSARCCSGRGWSAPPAASCSASPSCAGAARSGSPPRASPSAPSPILACAGLAIIPRYTMLAAAVLGDLRRPQPARLAAARARPSLAPALAGLRRGCRADDRRLGARTSTTSCTGWTSTSPTRPRSRRTSATSPTRAPSSRSAADLGPQPPRRPAPRLRPRPATERDRQLQRAGSAPRGYFLDPASEFVVQNFILDPKDPHRLGDAGPPRVPQGRPQTGPGYSTGAADEPECRDPILIASTAPSS